MPASHATPARPRNPRPWILRSQINLAVVAVVFGVMLIPGAVRTLAPFYADFGVELPALAIAVMGVPQTLLIAGSVVLAVLALLPVARVAGRSVWILYSVGWIGVLLLGLGAMLALLAPVVSMAESLGEM